MRKINNKGVTLIELIVSFAIVGVAIIYFFQTLYTVKKVYSTARNETNKYVDKDYTYRILDKYFDSKSLFDTNNICNRLNLPCSDVKYVEYSNGMNHYTITFNDNYEGEFYKLKNIMNEFDLENSIITDGEGNEVIENCTYACAINTKINSDIHVSGNGEGNPSYLSLKVNQPIVYEKLTIERYKNRSELVCSYTINDGIPTVFNNNDFKHIDDEYFNGTLQRIKVIHPGNGYYNTCYASIKYIKFKES